MKLEPLSTLQLGLRTGTELFFSYIFHHPAQLESGYLLSHHVHNARAQAINCPAMLEIGRNEYLKKKKIGTQNQGVRRP